MLNNEQGIMIFEVKAITTWLYREVITITLPNTQTKNIRVVSDNKYTSIFKVHLFSIQHSKYLVAIKSNRISVIVF